MKKLTVKRLSFDAIFAALTVLFYYFPKFPLPFFPSFLEINFSMIAVLICTFMLGPVDAVICVLIRFLIKLPQTDTYWVGELSDFFLGTFVSIGAGVIYHYTKLKNKTLIALIVGVVIWIITGVLVNYFINIPLYEELCGGMDTIIGMSKDAFRIISFNHITNVTKENFMLYYLTLAVVPFNLLLGSIIAVITALVHKKLELLYDRIGNNHNNSIDNDEYDSNNLNELNNESVEKKDEVDNCKSLDEENL